jgi:hypothetical protein
MHTYVGQLPLANFDNVESNNEWFVLVYELYYDYEKGKF